MTRKIGSRYTVTRVIGRGTCGTVWEGAGPDGPVAVKLLREDLAADQTLIARFVQERTVLTSLVHPNVVAVRDLVVDGTDLALVMDLVRGTDLRERLETQRVLTPAAAVSIASDIAAGLAAAHARGVVHRDVKPENVLMESATGAARLTDFGIARLVDGPRRTRATRIVGTPDYLAPEVIEGCPPGPPVDVYALGTLIFELLTGWTPFGGGHPGAVLRRHVTEPVPDVPGMPEAIGELLTVCLSKAPAARLTAAEVAGRLRMLAPGLAGLPALRLADPRAVLDPVALAAGAGRAVPMSVGAVPLVRGSGDRTDAARQTHVNLMRPIREPLGPSAPIPGTVPKPPQQRESVDTRDSTAAGSTSHAVNAPAAAGGSGGSGGLGGTRSGIGGLSTAFSRPVGVGRLRGTRVQAIAAVVAAAVVATGGYLLSKGDSGSAREPARVSKPGKATSLSGAAASPSASPVETKPVGPLGLLPLGGVEAPPARPIGAVRYVDAGNAAYVVMTGADGVVRYAPGSAGRSPRFTAWQALPGLTAAAEPAVIGRPSGSVEIYAVSNDGQMHRAVLSDGAPSRWDSLTGAGIGSIRVAGAPAAVPLSGGRTELLVASRAGSLLTAEGYGRPGGRWKPWHVIGSAGSIKPDVAVAVRADGTLAAYVIRASDLADVRLIDDRWWGSTYPTGAVGQPEAGYVSGGKPYLFIQSVAGDVQVYEPSGADLHGSMNWAPVGVTSQNPVGVTPVAGLGLVLATTSADGTVRLYATNA
ncbi:serine/threonine protein kinase [Actinocrinis puniceicyclus]|uniref:non-specific serine/threonine protein kinase n=1 Tax=Actinocrinis puniceicyclus TaxID=977794 RepID=A0A8J7WTP7_9ACTN|nr:protein kinase [Actinocrinis puniceicyclus]MBS2965822.1 serine/threonine protein kinase [Actinocrinis puniceicyclus]